MAFAPTSTYFDKGDGWPHRVWVTNPIENIDSGFRYARVLKTVAYIVVDEDEYGDAIVEKWNIKKQRIYERRLS